MQLRDASKENGEVLGHGSRTLRDGRAWARGIGGSFGVDLGTRGGSRGGPAHDLTAVDEEHVVVVALGVVDTRRLLLEQLARVGEEDALPRRAGAVGGGGAQLDNCVLYVSPSLTASVQVQRTMRYVLTRATYHLTSNEHARRVGVIAPSLPPPLSPLGRLLVGGVE